MATAVGMRHLTRNIKFPNKVLQPLVFDTHVLASILSLTVVHFQANSTKVFVHPSENNKFATNRNVKVNGFMQDVVEHDVDDQHTRTVFSVQNGKTGATEKSMETPEKLLTEIYSELRSKQKEARDDAAPSGCDEWVLIAMVLDRIFLALFLVVTVVTTLAIFLNRP